MYLQMNLLTNFVIQQYFANSRCIFIFTDDFNYIEYTGSVPAVKINKLDHDLLFRYHGCQELVIKSNTPLTVFIHFEEQIRLTMERFNFRKYLFLIGSNPKENLSSIFELEEINYVSDILLILPENFSNEYYGGKKLDNLNGEEQADEVYELLTHKYIGINDNHESILLDKWFSQNQSFLFGNNLYPDKLTNQEERQLKMAAFTYEPYVIIGNTSAEEYHGSELMTAVTFATKYNMTPIFVVNPEDYWGEIYSNWSGNGLLGNLVENNADIGYSALYTWEHEYHFLDLSKPLVRTGITCLVPAPKLAAGWLTPLYSYSMEMWISVVILLLICSFVLFFMNSCYEKNDIMRSIHNIRKHEKLTSIFQNSLLILGKPLILQPLTQYEFKQGLSRKYFTILILMLSLFLSSTYSGGLASIMTVPRYEDAINTVEDFADSGLYWGATQNAWTSSIQDSNDSRYMEIVSRFLAKNEDVLRRYSLTEQFAFSIERLPMENFAVGSYIKQDVISKYHLMNNDLYWEQCVIMTRKSSILLPLLDNHILRVFEAGLISHWQNEAVTLYMDQPVQKAVRFYNHRHSEQQVRKLQWMHVEGAFALLCIGYFISFIVFLAELVYKNSFLEKHSENFN